MKKKNCILTILILTILFLILLYQGYKIINSSLKEHFNSNLGIPKKIWTFWDNEDIPDIVLKCIGTWKKHNPNYEIIVVNNSNLLKYLPEVDFSKIKHINESPQKYSDMVRLYLLAKYGGIWSDATVICQKPYDSWITDMQKNNNYEFVGFYIDGFTLPQFKESSPVIENWFFACKKGSVMVNDWLKEFLKISNYDTVEKYVASVINDGINIQNISTPSYLSMHVACQKILQKGPNKPYHFTLLKAEDTAYKYLTKNNWDSKKAVQNILDCKKQKNNLENNLENNCDFLNSPIIKMRSAERTEMQKLNYSEIF